MIGRPKGSKSSSETKKNENDKSNNNAIKLHTDNSQKHHQKLASMRNAITCLDIQETPTCVAMHNFYHHLISVDSIHQHNIASKYPYSRHNNPPIILLPATMTVQQQPSTHSQFRTNHPIPSRRTITTTFHPFGKPFSRPHNLHHNHLRIILITKTTKGLNK